MVISLLFCFQEDFDKYQNVSAKLIDIKFLSETLKPDKTLTKHLDAELNNIRTNLKKLLTVQNEWTRLEDVLTDEQKWFDEIGGFSTLDLTKITSNNYVQTLSDTQVCRKLMDIFL